MLHWSSCLPAEFQKLPSSLLLLVLEAINHQEENVNFIRDNSSITAIFLFQSSKYNIFGHICVKKIQAKLITGSEMNIQEIHSCQRGRNRDNFYFLLFFKRSFHLFTIFDRRENSAGFKNCFDYCNIFSRANLLCFHFSLNVIIIKCA